MPQLSSMMVASDSIPPVRDGMVKKAIYSQQLKKRGKFYDMLWGKHYRDLYYTPITVRSTSLRSSFGRVEETDLANDFYGLYIKSSTGRSYLLKPIGGSSSFLKSDFFREMYNKKDFEDTYLDKFIGDAYTIINPYGFLASDYMAKVVGLNTSDPSLYYIPPRAITDTVMDGSDIQDRLVSICLLPDTVSQTNIITTSTLLQRIQADKSHKVDQAMYIRERLFDILIGDWNKIPENWVWIMKPRANDTIYEPVVIDRSHAFTKIDGLLSKQMLSVLAIGFIADYKDEVGNVKKANKLGFTTDVALSAQSTPDEWLKQAEYLKYVLTNDVIDEAFTHLPKEIQGVETDEIKRRLKKRRDHLTDTALKYYKDLQFNPIITGTAQNDTFVIDRFSRDSIRISMYNEGKPEPVFSQEYTKKNSKEIWIYGLDGDDSYEIKGDYRNKIPLYLLGGKGRNYYDIRSKSNLKIFGYKSHNTVLKSTDNAKVILTDNDNIHNYDYRKTRYKDISFSPWGIYDSDWGLSLGSFVSYTRYGLKRSPFSYQHRIGYNYLRG